MDFQNRFSYKKSKQNKFISGQNLEAKYFLKIIKDAFLGLELLHES